jgi:hypothetical protein
MKKSAIILLSVILVVSCSEPKLEEQPPMNQNTLIKPDTAIVVNSITESNFIEINTPCPEVQNFVLSLDNSKWIADTNRLNKKSIYPELDRENIKYFSNKPFYPIDFEDSRLNISYKRGMFNSTFNTSDFDNFKSVKNIWGYFYRDKNADGLITDGVIEQWEFDSDEKAKKAFNKFRTIGDLVYFNTMPYFYQIDNKLIVFQTRAMKFSFKQKELFDQFKKR